MTGYAVKIDGTGWRAVDGPEADPEDQGKIFPDPETERFSEVEPSPPVPLPLTDDELKEAASKHRKILLQNAAIDIAPLQDAVDLGSSTESEVSMLNLLKQYRIDVNRVADQKGYPKVIVWPEYPK